VKPAPPTVTSPDARPADDGEPRAPAEVMIRLAGVHKSFGPKQVLVGLDLEVMRGETFVIVGPSGTGKSCLLKLIVGLMAPDQGEVWLGKQRVDGATRQTLHEVRARVGYLFQSSALINWLDVGENVALPLTEHTRLRPFEIERRVDEYLAMVHLQPSKRQMPDELSGGQKRRAALARVLAGAPTVILYDEPTAGLDPVMTANIAQLIRKVQRELGVTSILVTHDLPAAYEAGDRIAMVDGGKIVFQATAAEFQKSEHPAVRYFLNGGRPPIGGKS
jgi:phospholipid/cholesterol/gamma-HCH transport system ATP-binding protein